ncbi:electron transfer flavoprotein subunit alpha/FixB family protein [Mycoplasmatota bacterium]|nr:electron transfer flavoprotein subunit alpha/FixB family protein [Mycoplasmatota bacterium]
MCKLCVKKGPAGVCEFIETVKESINKDDWKGICVYVEHDEERIHPVTFELIGKAQELAKKINHPVHAIIIGDDIDDMVEEILHYGVDEVIKVKNNELKQFNIELYTTVLTQYVKQYKPSSILIGATPLGRSYAPRVAARLKTGLTADCTFLDVKENTDLIQIRPAFGGNIMASIITPNNRPQIATVRYKVFNKPEVGKKIGKVSSLSLEGINLDTKIKLHEIKQKEKGIDIAEAPVIISCGRSFKSKEDLKMVYELANLLGAEVACTRPLIENGWFDPRRQIGLSGRTVAPKLLINLGISGAVQYVAGIKNSETIISVNIDKNASIMDVSHLGIIGDIYEVIPNLIKKIKEDGEINGI